MESPTRTTDDATAANGRVCVDTSGNPRIPILMRMVESMSLATTPQEVLTTFADGFRELDGPRAYASLSTRDLEPGEYRITRMLLEEVPEGIGATDSWNDRDRIPIHRGGFFGDIIRQAHPEIIRNVFLTGDPVIGDALKDFGSIMAVPLFDEGKPLNWAISLRPEAEGFSVEELEEAILRSNLVGSNVRNVLAANEIHAAHKVIRREVEQIATIQKALLPDFMPLIPGLTVAVTYETHDEAGGDYYDFVPVGAGPDHDPAGPWDGPWAILVADAAGHGPAATVLMAMLRTILHTYPRVAATASEVLEYANRHLHRRGLEASFVTAFFAIYHPDTRELVYARAGHPPPILKNPGPGGTVERLDAVGTVPLGVLPDAGFEDASITLVPGQTVVLYTDGIPESMSPNGVMFEVAGIERALHECTGEPGCVLQSVGTALTAHRATSVRDDDQTLVAMRVDG